MVGGSSALTLDSHSGAVTPGGFGIWLLKAGLYPNPPPAPISTDPKGTEGKCGQGCSGARSSFSEVWSQALNSQSQLAFLTTLQSSTKQMRVLSQWG